jgi:ankyrin repeat protein
MRTPLEKTFFRMVQASDSFEVNNMLIKNPKLLACTDSKGNTVLHEVSKLGDTELLTVLLEYGGISLLNAKNNVP